MKKLIDTNEWYARVYVSMPLLKEKENAGYDLNLGAVVLNCEGRTFVLDSYETSFTSEAEEGEDFELCSKLEIDLDTFPVDKEFNGHGYILVPFFTAWNYSRCYASALACGWLVSKLFFLFF